MHCCIGRQLVELKIIGRLLWNVLVLEHKITQGVKNRASLINLDSTNNMRSMTDNRMSAAVNAPACKFLQEIRSFTLHGTAHLMPVDRYDDIVRLKRRLINGFLDSGHIRRMDGGLFSHLVCHLKCQCVEFDNVFGERRKIPLCTDNFPLGVHFSQGRYFFQGFSMCGIEKIGGVEAKAIDARASDDRMGSAAGHCRRVKA